MQLGFFHDSKLVFDEGKYYSRTLSEVVWKRYLSVFDEIVVSTRVSSATHGEMGLSEYNGVSFNPIRSYSAPVDLIKKFPKIVKEISAALDQVDCAIVRLPSVIGWIATALAKKKGKPVLIEVVGCPWDAYWYHSFAGKVLAPIGFLANRIALKNATFALYVTQEFLQSRYPTQGVNAGISDVNISISELALLNRLEKISEYQRDNSCNLVLSEPLTFGSIGQIDLSYKGHAVAIRGLKALRDEGINLKYEIVGAGNPTTLQNLIHELDLQGFVTLQGPFSKDQVHNWLEGLDFYVQPSFQEGLPRSVVEAMSHALPVLVSNVGGQPELVDREFVFKAGDSSAISATIKKLLLRDWTELAKQNFDKSCEFKGDILQSRREQLLEQFRKSATA